ncbi:unnamed protein product [Moneuplotes crassus]|uniref:Uncharacterized protein n=1 Tax=Euplotes crassus TaxID=5936 RepID=A0AAD1XLG3_EUPCR|nr:unnamed protein product [Moneuplotes crassus]
MPKSHERYAYIQNCSLKKARCARDQKKWNLANSLMPSYLTGLLLRVF